MQSKKTLKPTFLAAGVVTLLVFMAGCYYMPGSGAGAARVIIGVKGVPVNLVSAAVVVTAPGMATISTNVSASANSVTVSVPPGPARTFTLLLNSASATLQAVATVDLQPGENRTINVTPTLGATQIVIPDFNNGQIVQISDMNGTGWTAKTVADFTGVTSFSPYAVDFDNLGRIYIANNTPSSTDPGVIRIDDINHTSTFTQVDTTYATGIKSVAIDRMNGLIYYNQGSTTLYEKDVNNIGASAITSALVNDISSLASGPNGIAVDDQGMLYMTIPTATLPARVVKYNPTRPLGSRLVTTSSYGLTSPWGIMVKGPYVYVNDSGAAKLVRFDTNLNFVDSFPGPSTDPFYGPETFVATLNRKLTVIDEKGGPYDRLASFDDMTGAGWTTYGSNGTTPKTPGIFNFYGFC